MKKTRESLVFWGVLFLVLGWVLRSFESVELKPVTTQIIQHYKPAVATSLWASAPTAARVPLPDYWGWIGLTAGVVLLFESCITPKQG